MECMNPPVLRILKGRTRTVRLTLNDGAGHPVDLTQASLIVVSIRRDGSGDEIKLGTSSDYSVQPVITGDSNNVLQFVWYADLQRFAGRYTFTVFVDYGDRNVDKFNWHGPTGIELVEYAVDENLSNVDDLSVADYIDLTGSLTANGVGQSAYQCWISLGHEGSESDFMDWLRKPAVEAADAAGITMGIIQERADEDHRVAGDDHTLAVSDHGTAGDDHTLAVSDHGTAEDDHRLAASDHGTASDDHTLAVADHGTAGDDHTLAVADHGTAGDDHTLAAADHLQAVSDHQTWSNKADKDTDAVEGNLAKFDSSGNPVDAGYSAARIHRDLGYNAAQGTIVLTPGVTGKYVKCSTRAATANENFNISAPFDVDACSELLIKTGYNPSDNDHASLDISVISIYEEMQRTRTVQAKNDQNQPLYYEVDEDGNPTSTQTTEVTPFPVYTTETYTESRYLPNNEDRFVQIPDSGYYVANIPQRCKCVISYKPGVTDLNVIVVKHGALANLTSQIFGIYEHRTMSEAVVSLALRLDAVEKRLGQPGNILCGTVDAVEYTKLGYPQLVMAVGAPSANLRPTYPNGDPLPADLPWDGIPPYIGHIYLDMTTNAVKLYFAKGISAISDYIPLN